MRSKLAVAAGGLVLAVAVGIPAGAQAAVTPSVAAHSSAAGVTPAVSTNCSSNGTLYDKGNGEYATNGATSTDIPALYFNPSENISGIPAELYCAVNYGGNEYNIEQPADPTIGTPASCVSVNSTEQWVGWEYACGHSWDKWEPTKVGTYHSQAVYILKSAYNGQCLYDYKQEPAIYTTNGCSTSDTFEQFIFDSLP